MPLDSLCIPTEGYIRILLNPGSGVRAVFANPPISTEPAFEPFTVSPRPCLADFFPAASLNDWDLATQTEGNES